MVLRMVARNSDIHNIWKATGAHRQTVLRWFNREAERCQLSTRLESYASVHLDQLWTFVSQRKRWIFYSCVLDTDQVLACSIFKKKYT